MDALTLYGFISVTAMLVAYALEQRGRIWILIFSIACLSAAFYGLLTRTFPFALVEGIWAIVAFKRWWRASPIQQPEPASMNQNTIIIDGISADAERRILQELEKRGVLVTCATCGQCDLEGARCIVTVRGNGICGKGLRVAG